jgi:hypothetical protein
MQKEIRVDINRVTPFTPARFLHPPAKTPVILPIDSNFPTSHSGPLGPLWASAPRLIVASLDLQLW